MRHLTDEILECYERGELSPVSVQAVEEHLLVYELCRQLDTQVREYIAIIKATLRQIGGRQGSVELLRTASALRSYFAAAGGVSAAGLAPADGLATAAGLGFGAQKSGSAAMNSFEG